MSLRPKKLLNPKQSILQPLILKKKKHKESATLKSARAINAVYNFCSYKRPHSKAKAEKLVKPPKSP